MKVQKAEIITMNERYLRDWVPSILEAAEDAFRAEAESRITVRLEKPVDESAHAGSSGKEGSHVHES